MKKFISLALITALTLSLVGCGTKDSTSSSASNAESNTTKEATSTDTSSYGGGIFDTSYVHSINVEISDEDWADLLANPTEKTKYQVNVTIDGNDVKDVSFATKGNTSLSSIADDDDSNKYSFKINFGKYVDGQTYAGLDKLNLNNIYADATYMKDYMSYMISAAAGVDAPECSYVWVTVNGEDQGLYLALENVDESYLSNSDSDSTEIYKPETSMLNNVGNGGMKGGDMKRPDSTGTDAEGMTPPTGQDGQQMTPPDFQNGEMPQMPTDGERPELPDGAQMGDFTDNQGKNGGPGGFSFGSDDSGASLKYTDDSVESYSDIFDNAETEGSEESQTRVIKSLKALNEYLSGDTSINLEDYIDTEEVINYFAAHNFVLNYDSYTGNMLHNYYLLETDGKLSMVPWDYNLAFGAFAGMGDGQNIKFGANASDTSTSSDATDESANDKPAMTSGSATSLINTGIDSPLKGAEESDRPMWAWITSNEKYLTQYHTAMDNLLKNYFENGTYANEISRVKEMIRSYVEKDTYASYSVDEFDTAVENLLTFGELRAESIRKQLDGSLASVTSEQKSENQVDASSLNIQAMGSQGGNKGGKDGNGGFPGGNGGFPGGNQDGQNTFPGGSQDNQNNFPGGPNENQKETSTEEGK